MLSERKMLAGSKIIITFAGGRERTFVARDYTMSAMTRKYWAVALRDRASSKGCRA